jgi:hypothetical protein
MKKVLVAVTLIAAACGSDNSSVKASSGGDTPDWVSQGNGSVNAEAGKKLLAIGSSNTQDPKARRHAADAAAAQQMDTELSSLSAALSKLSESTGDTVGDQIAKITRSAAQSAAGIRDHYVGGDGNEMSLEVLELSAFTSAVQNVDGDDKLKKEVAGNAAKAFDSLAVKQ